MVSLSILKFFNKLFVELVVLPTSVASTKLLLIDTAAPNPVPGPK
jgi:hypothetical protein